MKLSLEMNRLLLLLILFPAVVFCQNSIETDRPDQTEASSIVPAKFLQAEVGFLHEKVDDDISSSLYPSILWRYGVNNQFELRLITEFGSQNIQKVKSSGFSPVAVGFKTKLSEEKNILPEISFIGHLGIGQVASSPYSATGIAPDFRFLFSNTINEKLSIGYNLGAYWNHDSPAANGIYTIAAAYSLTNKLGGFAEFFGSYNAESSPSHSFDGGLTYLISEDFQLDASAGVGISRSAPDFFIGGGLSYRLPLN